MGNLLASARRPGFLRSETGNVGILFAAAAVPMIALLGGAVDVARYTRHKAELANALDAAAIALARQPEMTDAAASAFVTRYVEGLLGEPRRMLDLAGFEARRTDSGYVVEARGAMRAAFLPVIGIDGMPLDLATEVAASAGKYEIALALDNTGSMAQNGKIAALRQAASDLVDTLYSEPGADERVKVALVPFVTAVNVKGKAFDWSWIERAGDSATYGFNFKDGKAVDRVELFARMGAAWRGCVEARAGGLDETDDPPTSAATRWVPYLWPDEPDQNRYGNNYLADGTSGDDWTRLRNVAKYADKARIDDPLAGGPNKACPRPIVELTDDVGRMKSEIARMQPHPASGTNIAQGLVWGWRVLSPEAPFTEGAPYSDKETTKVLVLLSDGRNEIVDHHAATVKSDYTSYGYLAQKRLGADTRSGAEIATDRKVARICASVKGRNVRVYTILFQVNAANIQDVFRDCASRGEDGQPLYYYAPDAATLQTAFRDIGEDLTSLRIAR
ncbi:pilus assembly protein TadG-related protein [Faunimonas sp. B44]|uniref:pilus assembly protein TadG-related protein n=1 Tax=Faunimonas sp. B44 TaxID=3461493 RepID=UPI0040443238